MKAQPINKIQNTFLKEKIEKQIHNVNEDVYDLTSVDLDEISKFNGKTIRKIIEHFKVLTEIKSKKDGKPHLTSEQFTYFIEVAFINYDKDNPPMNKIEINFKHGEISNIKEIFYNFYISSTNEYESTKKRL